MDAMDTFPAGMRVLAVDDDRVSLKLIEQQLHICKYNVTTAMSAEAALEMLRARKEDNQFDMVITDVHMPGMDGFKLLELIGLEMDIPVIMLSANDEKETMMKGITHGAWDYLVKPVRLEQIRNLWVHVVKKNTPDPANHISGGNDDAGQKLQPGDAEGEKDGAKCTRKYSRKNKKDGDGTGEDRENTSSQKKKRIQWSPQLHRHFVEVVHQFGLDKAVPKKILEMMKVDGLTRENVASHLQKYRLYLRKLSDGTFRRSNLFADGSVWNTGNAISMNGPESFRNPSFAGCSNSSNPFARMNSPSAFGTYGLLPTQSVHHMNAQRNLGIPRNDMGPVGHGGNLLKDAVPGSQNYASKFIPSDPSGSSFANASNSMPFNTSTSFPSGTSGNSFANTSSDSKPVAANIGFSSSRTGQCYASILRSKILGASRGIPFDADSSCENIADGEILAPSSHLLVQSRELESQPSFQMQSPSPGLFNKVVREPPRFAGISSSSNTWNTAVPSKFPDLGHMNGTSEGPSQGNSLTLNQFSRFAASSGQMPTSRNEFQNQMAALMRRKTTPVLGFNEQVAPFNLGSNAKSTAMPTDNSALGSASGIIPTLPNLQNGNSVMPIQMLNGEGASGNLPENGMVDQQAVGDQLNNNEPLMGTSQAQNGISGGMDEIFADWVNQDFFENDDAFMDGDWEFAP